MDDDSPGTPLGRLAVLARYAEQRCGHNPLSGKPAELALITRIENLEKALSDIVGVAESGEYTSFEMIESIQRINVLLDRK